jgi:hypothetical protein
VNVKSVKHNLCRPWIKCTHTKSAAHFFIQKQYWTPIHWHLCPSILMTWYPSLWLNFWFEVRWTPIRNLPWSTLRSQAVTLGGHWEPNTAVLVPLEAGVPVSSPAADQVEGWTAQYPDQQPGPASRSALIWCSFLPRWQLHPRDDGRFRVVTLWNGQTTFKRIFYNYFHCL